MILTPYVADVLGVYLLLTDVLGGVYLLLLNV